MTIALPSLATHRSHMGRPERIEDLDDIKAWIAEHDGRIDAWWDEQKRWNADTNRRMGDFHTRLTTMEKRVMYFSGAASLVGAVAGALIASGLLT